MKQEFYDELSALLEWHWWYRGRKRIVLGQLEKYYGPKRTNILDIGCGPGGMLNDLSKFGKVYGIDDNMKSISICKEKGYSNTFISNVENLPFSDSFFSAVLMLDMLEHVGNDKVALKEALRVCKPGGIILLTVPAFQLLWGYQDVVCHHKRRYTTRDIKSLVCSEELHIAKISYFNFFLFPVVAALRTLEKVMPDNCKSKKTTVNPEFSYNKPGTFNDFLTAIFSLESKLLSFLSLPFGVSLLCVLRKSTVASS